MSAETCRLVDRHALSVATAPKSQGILWYRLGMTMSFRRELLRAECVGVSSLLVFAVLAGVLVALDAVPDYGSGFSVVKWFGLGFAATLIAGVLPVTLIAAPLFAISPVKTTLTTITFIVCAMIPGIFALLFDTRAGLIGIAAGLFIAVLMLGIDRLTRKKAPR